ncbi:hypothetical protein KUL72_29855 [Bradyrhizobium arachidis]|uniref:hypothetical protein n=1 Tax=Bradyrhizobium arachidis TaxID=858423 RepID=UPI0021612A0D|nr:hypothetical protein [Bradyrhizobium arachidis]UVO35600.1 hypothetical protein KUL72_29855 [Bradyrhizobium arachidis]
MIQKQRTKLASDLGLRYGTIALGLAMATVMLAPANALDQAPTAEEKEACMEDVLRLCSSHIPDRAAITVCLRSKQDRLSQQCRYVISGRDIGNKSSRSK